MNEKIKRNLKVYLAVIYVLIYSSCILLTFRHGITEPVIKSAIKSYMFTPYIIGLVLSFGYLYSIKKEFRTLYNICSFAIIMFYTYTFMWLNGSTIGGYKLGIGSYIYIATFFLFFTNFFIRTPIEYDTYINGKKGSGNKMIKNPIDVKNDYVLANYTSGYDKYIKSKSNLSAIMKKENTDKIQIAIYSKNPVKVDIKLKDIENVHIKKDTLKTYKKTFRQDREEERATVQTFLIGYFGAFAGSEKLVNDIDEYNELEQSEIYEITLNYKDRESEKFLKFETKIDPTEFFKKIGISILT